MRPGEAGHREDFPLEEAAAALQLLEKEHPARKVVLTVS